MNKTRYEMRQKSKLSTLNRWLRLRMASISPTSQEVSFRANPGNNSSGGSTESAPLLLPVSTLIGEADRICEKHSPLTGDTSEKSSPMSNISDINSPLIFKRQNKKVEELSSPNSTLDDSPRDLCYGYSQDFTREIGRIWNENIEQATGTKSLSLDSNEECCCSSSCWGLSFFNNMSLCFPFRLWTGPPNSNRL